MTLPEKMKSFFAGVNTISNGTGMGKLAIAAVVAASLGMSGCGPSTANDVPDASLADYSNYQIVSQNDSNLGTISRFSRDMICVDVGGSDCLSGVNLDSLNERLDQADQNNSQSIKVVSVDLGKAQNSGRKSLGSLMQLSSDISCLSEHSISKRETHNTTSCVNVSKNGELVGKLQNFRDRNDLGTSQGM